MAIAFKELAFLRTEEAAVLLSQCQGKDALAVAKLCAHLDPEKRRSLTEYMALIPKMRRKFATEHSLLLDGLAYEQSTAADLSKWKASGVPKHWVVADLCCGMGADSMYLDPSIKVLGVDLSMERCAMFQHNMETMRPGALQQVVCADATVLPLQGVDLWFCDPDRRGGERHGQWDPSQMRPSFEELDQMLQFCPRAMLKLPPSTDFRALPWKNARYSYLGDRKSCRELLVEIAPEFSGSLRAVHVDQDQCLEGGLQERWGVPVRDLSKWLYEPSPVAIRSKLYLQVAHDLQLWQLDSQIPYLSGDLAVESPFLERFQVLESMSWDKKALKKALKKWDAAEVVVKKRAVDVDPDALARELSNKKGSQKICLFITSLGSKVIAVLALRA